MKAIELFITGVLFGLLIACGMAAYVKYFDNPNTDTPINIETLNEELQPTGPAKGVDAEIMLEFRCENGHGAGFLCTLPSIWAPGGTAEGINCNISSSVKSYKYAKWVK
jgi:hypothetical protein